MGWTWNHAPTGTGTGGCSYDIHADLGYELGRRADRTQWAALTLLFDRATYEPFDVPAAAAARIAVALTQLAPHVGAARTGMVYELAAAARAAHRAGAVWHWS